MDYTFDVENFLPAPKQQHLPPIPAQLSNQFNSQNDHSSNLQPILSYPNLLCIPIRSRLFPRVQLFHSTSAFFRLWPSIRLRIYALALDLSTPRLVHITHTPEFLQTHIHAQFFAPSDPYTVPEWEARLPREALAALTQNQGLTLSHLCTEAQQWRCLRGFLYNPYRQAYHVGSPDAVARCWGKGEVEARSEMWSVPWRFELNERYREWRRKPVRLNNKIDGDGNGLGLHECFWHVMVKGRSKGVLCGHREFGMVEGVQEVGDVCRSVDGGDRSVGGEIEGKGSVESELFFGFHLWESEELKFLDEVKKQPQEREVLSESSVLCAVAGFLMLLVSAALSQPGRAIGMCNKARIVKSRPNM
ncbi:hypothetical protein EJ04DRAFT_519657 [Polyplosphaeria fusca]|uniref:Uncharacterized protein n=1 Tax=Polyplosphaeria fusca TaxID=682080 RepID=A0A9P4R974_9PLEO|nr:hypothetical protein EJ04DRAFT_519657 [Polyplosphaeria fusca]